MLRALILSASLLASSIAAQSLSEAERGALIDGALEQAQIDGAALKERITLFARKFNIPEDIARRGLEELGNERVRELLGIQDQPLPNGQGGTGRYQGGVFVFASFSMPPQSLRQLLLDATQFDVPVIFNGFADNSVLVTEAKLRAAIDEETQTNGFLIDPTLFTRFEVKAVPTLVSTTANLDVCQSPDCSEDGTPPHDRASGNVPLAYLLQTIARGGADHAEPAARLLGEQP